MLSAALIHEASPQWRVLCFEETTSTNDIARDLGNQGEDGGIAVLAEHQTAGRGQRQNKWLMPPSLDIMMSVLLRPSQPIELWPRLTTLAAVAVCRAIEATTPLHCGIKWPNDIFVKGKKIAGLLAETSLSSTRGNFVVLGMGINVNTTHFPVEIESTATSLRLSMGSISSLLPREPIAAAVLNQLTETLLQMDHDFPQAVMSARERSVLTGKNIRARVESGTVYGRVVDLSNEGYLMLETPSGQYLELTSAAEVRLE